MVPPAGTQSFPASGLAAEERVIAAGIYSDGSLTDSLLPDYESYVSRMMQGGDVSPNQQPSQPSHEEATQPFGSRRSASGVNQPFTGVLADVEKLNTSKREHMAVQEDLSRVFNGGLDPDLDDSISEYEADTRSSHQQLDDSPAFGQRTSLQAKAIGTSIRSLREQRSAASLNSTGTKAARPEVSHRPVIRRSPTYEEDTTLLSPRELRSNSLGGMAAGKNAENYAAPPATSQTMSSVAERNRLRQSLTGRKPSVRGPSGLRNEQELEVELSEFSNGSPSQMSETNGETSMDEDDRPRPVGGNFALRAAAAAALQHHHHPLDNHPHHYRQDPTFGTRQGAGRDPVPGPGRGARNITLGRDDSGYSRGGGAAAAAAAPAAQAAGLETVSRLKSLLKKNRQLFPTENGWAQGMSSQVSQTQGKRHITFGGGADEFR